MRSVAIVSFVLMLPTPFMAVASSMWCEPPRISPSEWTTEGMENGDAVFLGRVYSVREVPPVPAKTEDLPEPQTMDELLRRIQSNQVGALSRYDHVVSFEVLKAWKDPVHPIARTKVHLGQLKKHRKFEVGDVYLVIARELEGTLYWIRSRCVDAILEEWATEYEEALNTLDSSQ